MDTLRSIDADVDVSATDEPRMDPPPAIGTDERRMHVRAYNYWVSLLHGRAYPSIEDLDPASIEDFGPHSVLLDFSAGPDNPLVPFLGRALREEGGHGEIEHVVDVPSGSLISRLTDHYLQIIANHAPIGFEAEFVNCRGNNTMYRGILMPFSSNGDAIDFIYGVINWKEVVDAPTTNGIHREIAQAARKTPVLPAAGPVWADGPNAGPRGIGQYVLPEAEYEAPLFPDDTDDAEIVRHAELRVGKAIPGGYVLPETEYDSPLPGANDDDDDALDEDAGLADHLAAARECADAARTDDARSRVSLYRALGLAYDFALLTAHRGEEYAELLADSGLKAQERAPMTPVVKLVFGAEYDKTRLTEYAAVLAHGRRIGIPPGEMKAFLGKARQGVKGVVAAERAARRPASRPDAGEAARARLRLATPRATIAIGAIEEEFVLLVARREADGSLAVFAPLTDKALVDRAIRKIAG